MFPSNVEGLIFFILCSLPFNWLYIHSGIKEIKTEACQTTLVESLFLHKPTPYDLTRAICLIIHGIAGARQQDEALKAHFSLLAKLFMTAKAALLMDLTGLKEMIFVQSGVVKDVLASPTSAKVLEGASKSTINHTSVLKLSRLEISSRSCS